MKLGTIILSAQRTNSNDFNDALTFNVSPPAGERTNLFQSSLCFPDLMTLRASAKITAN